MGEVGGPGGLVGLDRVPSVLGGHLLGLLFRAAVPNSPGAAADDHLGFEDLGVVRPAVGDPINGQLVEGLGTELLKARLVVVVAGPFGRLPQPFLEEPENYGVGYGVTRVQVYRPDQCFHRVGKNRGLQPSAR